MPNSFKAFTHPVKYRENPMVAAAQQMYRKRAIQAVENSNRQANGFPKLAGVSLGDLDTGMDDSFIYGDYSGGGGSGSGGGSGFPDWLQQDFSGGGAGLFTDIDNWWNTSGPDTWFVGCKNGICSDSGSGSGGGSYGGGSGGGSGSGGGINWASIFAPIAQFGAAFGASQSGMVPIRGANGQITYVPANSPAALATGTVGLPGWVYLAGAGLLAYAMLRK